MNQRRCVVIPDGLWLALAQQACREGISRAELLRRAMRSKLDEDLQSDATAAPEADVEGGAG